MLINKIIIKNLKSINSLDVSCKDFNLIIGSNSSGKSTFVQALMMAAQGNANGQLIKMGEIREILTFGKTNEKTKITFNIREHNFDIELLDNEGTQEIFALKEQEEYDFDEMIRNDNKIINKSFNSSLKFDKINFNDVSVRVFLQSAIKYLSCNRVGAQDLYPKAFDKNDSIGINGEYTIDRIRTYEKLIAKSIRSKNGKILDEINYWLDKIVNTAIKIENIIRTPFVYASYSNDGVNFVSPKNMGSGISYLISVLTICLFSKKDDIIIIENPEIHLHPKAQAKLTEFLYFIANSGRQLFIETHSDHIFNGLRAGIATKTMDKEKISINFFNLDNGVTKNTVVEVGEYGKILNHKQDLFDQFDIDLDKMLGI